MNASTNQFALEACGTDCSAHTTPTSQGEQLISDRLRFVEWFKLFLEPAYRRRVVEKGIPWAPTSQDEVLRWYIDYLTFLRQEIKTQLQSVKALEKTWKTSSIHFRFSYPQFWTVLAKKHFRDTIKAAGFEDNDCHKITISLNEAEASAVQVIQENPNVRNGSTLLVMDVGGGTTDMATIRVDGLTDNTLRCHNLGLMQRVIGFSDAEKLWEDHVYRLLLALPHSREEEASPGWLRQVAVGIRRSDWFVSHVQMDSSGNHSNKIHLPTMAAITMLFTDVKMDDA